MKRLPFALLFSLIALCLLWELWLAPLRGAGTASILAFKVIPLLLAVSGFWADRLYTYKWMSLAVWLYFIEGTVRGWSDHGLSSQLAWIEAGLCVTLFIASVMRIRQLRIIA
jgi:uncharacterized membrane protein